VTTPGEIADRNSQLFWRFWSGVLIDILFMCEKQKLPLNFKLFQEEFVFFGLTLPFYLFSLALLFCSIPITFISAIQSL